MCGIAGVIRFDGGVVDPDVLHAMAARIVHRGPDDHGIWVHDSGTVGFAHRRLSIIDLAGSKQPMLSADGEHALCFNGEVFNYRELRTRLDYPWVTDGDTETILAGLAERGPVWVESLRGQFAFAYHDGRSRDLWLMRDRVGVLPLYYWTDGSMLAFASEIKALLPALPVMPAVDRESIADYLAHRSVPAPYTLFEGVMKVKPGHHLRVRADGRIDEAPYWSFPETQFDVTPAEAVALVDEALGQAVDTSMVADVDVGSYLSGGLDSSLIVALMTERTNARVQTFSAGFGDARVDETHHARRVADHLGTEHHEVTVLESDFQALWSDLTWHRDAPISEPADVAVYRLAQLARQHVKVVLSGEGSDELFAGYPKYAWAKPSSLVDLIPAGVRTPALDTLQRVMPGRLARPRVAVRALAARDEAERFRMWFSPFTESERFELSGRHGRDPNRAIYDDAHGDVIRRMLRVDCAAWLSDNLLERGDRMSMAASLELRPPFLDYPLVELAFRLPSSVKLRDGSGKWVVKEIARRHLPTEIIERPKAGFRVPLDAWFRGGLRDFARDALTGPDSFVSEVLDRDAVRGLLDRHEQGDANEEIRIWTLLCLEVWHRVFYGPDARV